MAFIVGDNVIDRNTGPVKKIISLFNAADELIQIK